MKKLIIIAAVAASAMAASAKEPTTMNTTDKNKTPIENLSLTNEWDKTFPKSDKVNHSKVVFPNRYGITIAADLYVPKNAQGKLPAIAVCGPFGAVKEQSSGLYAQELAEKGFMTLAFDPSFTGESGGRPRYMTSPDINTEDFSAAVDYLVTNPMVNPEAVGILGICGWGGIAINAAASDPRIKATVASTMYDMSRVSANGYFDADDSAEARNAQRRALAAQRTEDFRTGTPALAGGVPDTLPADAPKFLRDYHDYYKTARGYHPRSLNSNGGRNVSSVIPWINFPLMSRAGEIENAVMIVHGEKAHSFYFGNDAYKKLTVTPGKENNKVMMVVPGASHTDLYDQKDIIPFGSIEAFFREYLK
ncbi:MAG: alpha/beta hydrolase [Muribaculaceae bacterium]|nr:alpha/beta hydrolase [Muribaculaceae bacterium]